MCPDFEAVSSQQHFLFEPLKPFPDGCLVARSLHLHANNQLFCNIVNASDTDVVIKQNQALGHMTEADLVDEQFNRDVLTYVPLDLNKLQQSVIHTFTPTQSQDRKIKPFFELATWLKSTTTLTESVCVKLSSLNFWVHIR